MAITPHIQAEQAAILSVDKAVTPQIRAQQAASLVPYNVPAKHMQAEGAAFIMPIHRNAHIEAEQAAVLAVVSGRIAQPQVRVFTFTLDGHDFYVIRLGDQGTIAYDCYSQQWIDWTSGDNPFWRVNHAFNWIGAQALGSLTGSGTDILALDDVYGLMYFLNPTQPYDQHPDYLNPNQQVAFPRIVMAQTTATGRENVPCYVIFLDTDNYGFSETAFVPYVQLEYSDDQGQTFTDAGTITVPNPDIDTENYRWYSLGQVSSPGRLFRVTDNGLLARIDAMQMNDE